MLHHTVQLDDTHTLTTTGPDETHLSWSCSCGAERGEPANGAEVAFAVGAHLAG